MQIGMTTRASSHDSRLLHFENDEKELDFRLKQAKFPHLAQDQRTEAYPRRPESFEKKLKGGLILVTIVNFALIVGIPTMTLKQVKCIEDGVFNLFQGHYEYFLTQNAFKEQLLIASSLLADLLFLGWMATWVKNGGTFRLPIALVLTFALR